MLSKFVLLATLLLSKAGAKPPTELGQRLRAETPCILQAILESRSKKIDPTLPLPQIILDEETDLSEYQDDVEPQWNFRPDVVVNVFVAHRNKIYLFTDEKYYAPRGRFVEDSLAHELYHYVQVHYDKVPVDQFSDFEEVAAVEVQTEFRERFHKGLKGGRTICEMIKSENPKFSPAR